MPNPFLTAKDVIKNAAANGINTAADNLAALSIDECPIESGFLRSTAQYPGNDVTGGHSASPEDLEATVSYNTVYAAAQHEGFMTYERNGHEIVWIVKRHTDPGTKTHYLSDPLKAMAPRYEQVIGLLIERDLSVRFGL